ncbi:MAG: DUF4185 domain-containing protein [Bacilli bacterium]|nr:DUF4185 domain-containing protein [Bacilli bacterium]
MDTFRYSNKIKFAKFNSMVSGLFAVTPTTKWDVYGTDLGIPVYSEKEKKLWFFFGDTFATPLPSDQNWRGTVVGKVSNLDFSKGINFESFISDKDGKAINLIKHHKCKDSDCFEVTKICQGAVEVNGVMYAFYQSVRRWGEPGYWDVNYSGAIKSKDGGQTWERDYNLIWTGKIERYEKVVEQLANETADMEIADNHVDIYKHHCEAFSQIYPKKDKDGYIYLFGRRGGRQYGLSVARVLQQNIEKFDEVEYYVNIDGKRDWIKGIEGIKALNKYELESYILPLPVSNITIAYNEYIKKYIALYYKPSVGVVMRTSDQIYGLYEDEILLIKQDDKHLPNTPYGLYGGFTHDLMMKNDGEVMYFIISQWNKTVYCSELFEVHFK